MSLVTPDTGLAARICKALGIERAKYVAIHMAVNDVISVEVEYMPTVEQMKEVAEELEARQYLLVEKNDDA